MPGWGVKLGKTYISGADDDDILASSACSGLAVSGVGCMESPPKGLGLPALRTEDVTYTQTDGVEHFNDWYEPRIITLENVTVCDDSCGACGKSGSARRKLRDLYSEWRRVCCDTELVVYTDCHGQRDPDNPVIDDDSTATRVNLAFNPRALVAGYAGEYLPRNGWTSSWIDDVTDIPADLVADGVSSYNRITCPSAQNSVTGRGIDAYVAADAGSPGVMGDAIKRRVVPGLDYRISVYVRSSVAVPDARLVARFHDGAGNWVGAAVNGSSVAVAANTWTRLDQLVTAPASGNYIGFGTRLPATSLANFPASGTMDHVGLLIEQVSTLGDYFDGDSHNADDEVVGGQKYTYLWDGDPENSTSEQIAQTYIAGLADQSLTGPFGIVGRPRVADLEPIGSGSSCYQGPLRFDAKDHRVYVLDECGTPGYSKTASVTRGSLLLARCYTADAGGTPTRCYSGAGRCYSHEVDTSESVEPVAFTVGGTEKVNPMIVLMPQLTSPRVEILGAGGLQWVSFAATILDYPVTINTEKGTAFQNGQSVTHLLRGSIFIGLDPGDYTVRLLSGSDSDTGTAQVTWRDTVIHI